MTYDNARELLERAAAASRDSEAAGMHDLILAVEALTGALEADLAQVKIALGHVARHVEALH